MDKSVQSNGPSECIRFFKAAVQSVLPREMVRDSLRLSDDGELLINGQSVKVNGKIVVLAFGKAVFGMVQAVEDILGNRLSGGVASVPIGTLSSAHGKALKKVTAMEGGLNNSPDELSHKAATAIHSLAESLTADDVAIVLISGGGSALLPMPIPPISLIELTQLTSLISRKGATITELNIIRKQLEILKGGGLARLAYPAKVVSIILSDVIGDPLDIIASGPTTFDTSTAQNALDIIYKYGLETSISRSILHALQTSAKHHAFANSDISSDIVFFNVLNCIVGSNSIALKAAELLAQQSDYDVHVLTSILAGPSQNVSTFYAHLVRTIIDKAAKDADNKTYSALLQCNILPTETLQSVISNSALSLRGGRRVCLLAGGETVVTVTGQGRGGRCQELCLWAAKHLADTCGDVTYDVTLLCAGTDGQDGPTDAAGAYVTRDTATEAACHHLDINAYLANNDSYNFFSTLNNGQYLIQTGPTGTNVMDIHVIIIEPRNVC